MSSNKILDFVGGIIHQFENVKFSKPYNKTFVKKIIDGKASQNEIDNIKMFYSIIDNKKNVENKIFNKTDTKKNIDIIKAEIENKYTVFEGVPILKNSFSEEEPQESENEEEEKTDNVKIDNEENKKTDNVKIDNEENEKTEIIEEVDFEAEIQKMKEYKKIYDYQIKKMKEQQKEKLRKQKIEKMKAQNKPDEKEELKNLIENLINVDEEYKKDMLNLLEKLKPIHKQKKEKIILNKERNIKALKTDISKRYVCPWCHCFRKTEEKFFQHIDICEKYNDEDEEKLIILEEIRDERYKNYKCKTTEESIKQYNKKYGEDLGYIDNY